jgi:ribosomal-protein-alanine N-acetyltransferase
MVVPYRIRPARTADVPALVALERITFSDPWSRGDFVECLDAGLPVFVAEAGDRLAGYIVGRSVLDEAEILNLSVDLAARRRGVGHALVARVMDTFAAAGVGRVFLEVRESNLAAQRLYTAFGFRAVGRRSRYYRAPTEDAVVLQAVISAASPSA